MSVKYTLKIDGRKKVILVNSKNQVCCTWCGAIITGTSWQSSKVRGYFCGKECRDNGHQDEALIQESPRMARA